MPECYMCDELGTTVEHVPPKCLFPEKKDLPEGLDLRKQLITVDACEKHNTAKSMDDEYIFYTLVMNLPANEIGTNQFLTKVMRSIERNPSLIKKFIEKNQIVTLKDTETDECFETFAFEIDRNRFEKAIEMMARALYFSHYKQKWLSKVLVHPEFLLSLSESAIETNDLTSKMAQAADQLFKNKEFFGKNPDVFKYQVLENDSTKSDKVFRLHFYNGCKVTVFFRETEKNERPTFSSSENGSA